MKKLFIIMLSLLCCLTSCGRQQDATALENRPSSDNNLRYEDTTGMEETGRTSEEEAARAQERMKHDWHTEEWQVGKDPGQGFRLYALEYISNVESDIRQEYSSRSVFYKVWGHCLYALEEYRELEGSNTPNTFYMNTYNSVTGEISHQFLQVPLPQDYEEQKVALVDFDIQNEQEWVLFFQVWPREDDSETLAYLAVHVSAAGEELSLLDLYPAIQACGGKLDKYLYENCVCVDQQGYYYLRIEIAEETEGQEYFNLYVDPQIYILDPGGSLAGGMEAGAGDFPEFAFKTPEGNPIFCWQQQNGFYNLLQVYDMVRGETRKLAEIAEVTHVWGVRTGLLTEDGYLYYMMNEGGNNGILHRYDLYAGTRDVCLSYADLAMGSHYSSVYMLSGPDGLPLMVDVSGERAEICRLGRQKPEKEYIQLASLTEECSFVSDNAAVFSKKNMTHSLEVKKPDGNPEDYRTRVMADLAAGKGADIFYVSQADLKILYENGVLADLTEALPADLTERLYPGILDGGSIDGYQAGLILETYPRMMVVSQEYWEKDSWTLEQLLDMVDAHPELPYPIIHMDSYFDGYKILQMLLFQNMDNTPFLDLERGTCDFENPLFFRLLELARRYQDNPIRLSAGRNPARDLFEEGSYAAVIIDLWNGFPDFSLKMAQLGEACHIVGFPTEGEKDNYWQSNYYLAVNKETRNPELVYDYLEYLLSDEIQRKNICSVRKDMLDKCITVSDWDTEHPLHYTMAPGDYMELELKPDGSSWQEEYELLVERCMLETGDTSAIQQIIWEEVGDYFSGIKDARSVAGVIQNRVQLYLEEQN